MILKIIIIWAIFTLLMYGIIIYETKDAPRHDDW
jgi:hypothetical protein